MLKYAYINYSKVAATANSIPGSLPKGMAAKIIITPPRGELRQRFTNFLTLRQLARTAIESSIGWIYQLAKFHRRSPDLLGNEEIQAWLLHCPSAPLLLFGAIHCELCGVA